MENPRILKKSTGLLAIASILLASFGFMPLASEAGEQDTVAASASTVAFRPASVGNEERSANPSEQEPPATADTASTQAFRPAEGTGGSYVTGVPAMAMAFAPVAEKAGERTRSTDTASTLAFRPAEEKE